MKTQKKTGRWATALLALAAMAALAGKAGATNTSSYLNIDVTFNSAVSVSVDGENSSSGTAISWSGTPNAPVVSATSATVTNDSGIVTERWKLFTNANS